MYGGTKEELERLIADAATYTDVQKEMGITVDASSTSFDNIVNAIAVVQGHLGIAGATALEAGTTIEGSVNSMKAAWGNLVANIANENADLGELIDNLVVSLVGDGTSSNLGVLGNIMPAFERTLTGIGKIIERAVPIISDKLPGIVREILPSLLSAAVSLVNGLVNALPSIVQVLIEQAPMIINSLVNTMVGLLPQIIDLGLQLVISLANGIAENLSELIPAIVDAILMIVETLTSPEMLSQILDAALVLVVELAYGLMDAIPQLVDATFTIIEGLVEFLLDPNNIAKIVDAALRIVIALGIGLVKAIPKLLGYNSTLIKRLVKSFTDTDWGRVGKDIVRGLWEGIKSMAGWLGDKVSGFLNGLFRRAKKNEEINSPSKKWARFGKYMAEGLGEGWNDEFANVKDSIESGLNLNATANVTASGAKSTSNGFSGVNITVNVNGNATAETGNEIGRRIVNEMRYRGVLAHA